MSGSGPSCRSVTGDSSRTVRIDERGASRVRRQAEALDVDRLIGRLTVDEKGALLIGADFWHTAGIDRLGVPAIMVADGPHGLRARFDERVATGHGVTLASRPRERPKPVPDHP